MISQCMASGVVFNLQKLSLSGCVRSLSGCARHEADQAMVSDLEVETVACH